jgi:predicted alpha/beta superfamily hydrolase
MMLAFTASSTSHAETKIPTAAANVQVLEPLAIPGLNRNRIVRLYLPPGYEQTKRRYPVIYMHDGQNLFDTATAYAGEWGVDETLNALAASNKLEMIVVGIDNGQQKRLNELSPWTNTRFGDAEGKEYVQFIVDTLKPMIDRQYRTLRDRNNTAIMGSSMGGFISHYAIHEYPKTFGKAGIFSPSYWYSENVFEHTKKKRLPKSAKLYLMMGGNEGDEALADLNKMTMLLREQKYSASTLHSGVVSEGEHNEKLWRDEFPKAILWLFAKP